MCIAWVILRFRDRCIKKTTTKTPRISMEYFIDSPDTEYTTLLSAPISISIPNKGVAIPMYSGSAVPILHSV